MLKPIVALLAVLSITALTGCSNFNSAFKNALKDRQASPPLQHDPIARLEQKQRLVTVGDSISFDASRSLSKRDLPLTYRWFLLERPHGSQAQLQKDGELAQLQIDQPGEYRVSLVVNDGAFDSYPFEALVSTNKDKLDNVSFIVIGDAGTGSKQQYHVAAAIEQICQKKVCDFALGLGDNIYNAGPDSVTDSQFQEKFEKPYQQLNFPFYMVLGNHDSSGLMAGDGGFNARGGIEVEYSQHSQKWTMPERYYRITAPLGENPRQLYSLLLAAGKILIHPVGKLAQTHRLQSLQGDAAVRCRQSAPLPQTDNFKDGKGKGDRYALGLNGPDRREVPGAEVVDIPAIQRDQAAMRDLSGHCPQKRRLAGSIGADNGGDPPGLGFEIHPMQDFLASQTRLDPLCLECKYTGHRPRSPRRFNKIHKKTGAPSTAVTMPMGSSAGAMRRRSQLSGVTP